MDSPRSLFRKDTFTVGSSKEPVVSAAPINREISTQTPFYGSDLQAARSVDSSEPPRNAQRGMYKPRREKSLFGLSLYTAGTLLTFLRSSDAKQIMFQITFSGREGSGLGFGDNFVKEIE